MNLVKQVFDIGYFVRALHVQLRFGELSRAPLRLLRLEMSGETVECDWVARAADHWDEDIPRHEKGRNASTQALHDAIEVRDLLFSSLPKIGSATLRVFRDSGSGELKLVISGTVAREQIDVPHISSVAMRAKLLGLQFWLEDGILETLGSEEFTMSF